MRKVSHITKSNYFFALRIPGKKSGTILVAALFLILVLFTGNSGAAEIRNLLNIRNGFHTTFSRVVFDLDGPISFNVETNERDNYLVVELLNTTLSEYYYDAPFKFINDKLVISIQLEQRGKSTVIAKIRIKTAFQHRVFQLTDPFRIVVDIHFASYIVTNRHQVEPQSEIKTKDGEVASDPGIDSVRVGLNEKNNNAFIGKGKKDTELKTLQNMGEPVRPDSEYSGIPEGAPERRVSLFGLVLMAFALNVLIFWFLRFLRKKGVLDRPRVAFRSRKILANQYKEQAAPSNFSTVVMEENYPNPQAQRVSSFAKKVAEAYSATSGNRFININNRRGKIVWSSKRNYEAVFRLADKNWSIRDIARELNLGQDEVRLAINLRQNQSNRAAFDNPIPHQPANFEFAY